MNLRRGKSTFAPFTFILSRPNGYTMNGQASDQMSAAKVIGRRPFQRSQGQVTWEDDAEWEFKEVGGPSLTVLLPTAT